MFKCKLNKFGYDGYALAVRWMFDYIEIDMKLS